MLVPVDRWWCLPPSGGGHRGVGCVGLLGHQMRWWLRHGRLGRRGLCPRTCVKGACAGGTCAVGACTAVACSVMIPSAAVGHNVSEQQRPRDGAGPRAICGPVVDRTSYASARSSSSFLDRYRWSGKGHSTHRSYLCCVYQSLVLLHFPYQPHRARHAATVHENAP